jgi:hypothetical protein
MNRIAMATCGVAVVGLLAAGAATSHAAPIIDELPGNLFHQYNAPSDPNVGIAINNPQNMGGGAWSGNGPTYPTGGNSFVLDGDVTSQWDAGTFSGGGMLNVGITQGYYSADTSTFTTTPFGAIGTIRVWARQYLNNDGSSWTAFPQQVKIAYMTTANFNPGNGFSYNSDTLGVTPGLWNNAATISAVNGAAPANITYGTVGGWVDLDGQFTQGTVVESSNATRAYVDLSVNIPAGATSILLSFGQDNTGTGNQGGVAIRDIQAYAPLPEPGTASLLAIGSLALLRRRRQRL